MTPTGGPRKVAFFRERNDQLHFPQLDFDWHRTQRKGRLQARPTLFRASPYQNWYGRHSVFKPCQSNQMDRKEEIRGKTCVVKTTILWLEDFQRSEARNYLFLG